MNRVQTQEMVHAYQTGTVSRRDFLTRATAAFGSLAAANLLLAACTPVPTITPPPVVMSPQSQTRTNVTPPPGVQAGIITYQGQEGEELMGYLASSDESQRRKGVIVIQEWWGLNDHIKAVANRFAQAGFVALAPDLYHGVVTTEPDEARKLAMELGMRDAVGEIQQAMAYLQAQDQVEGKIGIVGFCMGGGLVLQTAASDMAGTVGAAIPFYGTPLTTAAAGNVQAPVLSFLGSADRIPASGYEAMHAVFTEAGLDHEFVLYEGAQHAFFNDTRASSYDAEAAVDAWERTLAWLEKHL